MSAPNGYAPKSYRRPRGLQRKGKLDRAPVKRTGVGGRPRTGDIDVDDPPESPKHYSPEQVLALHVFWQAVADVQSTALVRQRERLTAAQFLAGVYPFNMMQTFWAQVLGLDAKAAREQAMQRHGTAIARVLAHAERHRLARQSKAKA